MHKSLKLLTIAAAGILLSSTTLAATHHDDDDISRWTQDGVTHFGNSQFAPSGAASVQIGTVNGMVAPDTNIHTTKSRPFLKLLPRQKVQNPRGWKGYGYKKKTNSRVGRGSRR